MTRESMRVWETLRRRRRSLGAGEEPPDRPVQKYSNRADRVSGHGVQPDNQTGIGIRAQWPGRGAGVVGGETGRSDPPGPARRSLFCDTTALSVTML